MLRESSNERVRVKIRGGKEKVVRAFLAESKGLQRIVYEGLFDLAKQERD